METTFSAQRYARTLLALVFLISTALTCGSLPAWAWQSPLYGGDARPIVSNGVVYVGTVDGAIMAFDAGSGAMRWIFQTGHGLPPGDVTLFGGPLDLDRLDLRAEIRLTPLLAGSTLFAASADRNVYALDAADGHLRWKAELPARIFDLTIGDSVLLAVTIANGQTTLHALDTESGAETWQFAGRLMHCEAGKDRIYVTSAGGKDSNASFIQARDPDTGEELWTTELPAGYPLQPRSVNDVVLVAVAPPLNVKQPTTAWIALDAATGTIRWVFEAIGRKDYNYNHRSETAAIAGETAILTTDQGVAALEIATGNIRWQREIAELQDHALCDSATVVVTARAIEALDLKTGDVRWTRRHKDAVSKYHVLDSGALFLTSSKTTEVGFSFRQGQIEAVDLVTGKSRWVCRFKRPIHARPTLANGTLFVSTWAGRNKENSLGKLPSRAALVGIDAAAGTH